MNRKAESSTRRWILPEWGHPAKLRKGANCLGFEWKRSGGVFGGGHSALYEKRGSPRRNLSPFAGDMAERTTRAPSGTGGIKEILCSLILGGVNVQKAHQ